MEYKISGNSNEHNIIGELELSKWANEAEVIRCINSMIDTIYFHHPRLNSEFAPRISIDTGGEDDMETKEYAEIIKHLNEALKCFDKLESNGAIENTCFTIKRVKSELYDLQENEEKRKELKRLKCACDGVTESITYEHVGNLDWLIQEVLGTLDNRPNTQSDVIQRLYNCAMNLNGIEHTREYVLADMLIYCFVLSHMMLIPVDTLIARRLRSKLNKLGGV